MSKQQILELYLSIAPYGGNLQGVRAASRFYFGKEPRFLTTAEAALLVALPQSPERRRPDRFPDTARVARAAVGTAVVAGTAGAVHHYQDQKYAQQDYDQQQEMYDEQMEQQQQYAPPPPAPEEDMTAKLQELAQLHESGALTDEEFAAAKQKLLAS